MTDLEEDLDVELTSHPVRTRTPEWKRLDLEPAQAGKSLLHDDFGFPKVNKGKEKESVPLMEEFSSEPIIIKADNDKFIPPKSNFVSVGQKDNTWYSKEVTEVKTPKNKFIINNSEFVDIDSLQGSDPLGQKNSKEDNTAIQYIKKNIEEIEKTLINKLSKINNLEELDQLSQKVFGIEGWFDNVSAKIQQENLTKNADLADILNLSINTLSIEFESKKYEFLDQKTEDDFSEVEMLEDKVEEKAPTLKPELETGEYILYVEQKISSILSSKEEVIEEIYNLITNNDVELSSLVLLKKIPIDFGIILKE